MRSPRPRPSRPENGSKPLENRSFSSIFIDFQAIFIEKQSKKRRNRPSFGHFRPRFAGFGMVLRPNLGEERHKGRESGQISETKQRVWMGFEKARWSFFIDLA